MAVVAGDRLRPTQFRHPATGLAPVVQRLLHYFERVWSARRGRTEDVAQYSEDCKMRLPTGFLILGIACLCSGSWCASAATAGVFNQRAANASPYQRFVRAGKPHYIAPWARPSNESRDHGYSVGGGAPVLGEGRYADEGTWGWDYVPEYSKVRLDWWHGRRYQGGLGQFQPNRLKRSVVNSLER